MNELPFEQIGRIPAPGDNVAIATRRLDAGTAVAHEDGRFVLPHTVLEGHRFVLAPIAAGEPLLSWGLPFGIATRDLVPGEYVCNEKILAVLAERDVDFGLPERACFRDHVEPYAFDERTFTPGTQVARANTPATFRGYARPGRRGVGTRNFVVVLATTARTAAFAQALAARFEGVSDRHPSVDGVVAVTHTEGGGGRAPNNLELVLRTLAGFIVHPNVGAVLALDYGAEVYSNDTLRAYMRERDYPLDDVTHAFLRIAGDRGSELARAAAVIDGWLPRVAACERREAPLEHLKLALQCGGSDAFSGISGNPLAGWVAKELIRHGGAANLAETDELIGAEPYVLENVRAADTARAFLDKVARFKERAAHHGTTAEGNPSGGNNYRGLYNIALKSLGAARKRDPEVRLDHVIDYGAPMVSGGYYFMDSPGNDLESIAGQVASGANLILFITGNGSITNFPFVPTLKFVTTTGRFELLAGEMDVNAGRYNDGESMDALGAETFSLALRVASGERSKGEIAGHSQVSLWRDWQQTDASRVQAIRGAPRPDGRPLRAASAPPARLRVRAFKTAAGHSCDQVGLVMPTSLCSGQVARLAAEDLNRRGLEGVSRFVALVHTEGCGSANAEHLYLQTLLGHLLHPFVRHALLLEHGCEKTHNDAVRHYLESEGVATGRYGFASVQLDGGLTKVREKIAGWFTHALAAEPPLATEAVDAGVLRVGLVATDPLPASVAEALAALARSLVAAGATVVLPSNASVAGDEAFHRALLAEGEPWRASLAYGEPARAAGLHVMDAPTESAVETITGLGGTGVEVMLACVTGAPLQSHPMIPLLQASADEVMQRRFGTDLDVALHASAPPRDLAGQMLARIGETASREYTPRLFGLGNTQFQLTRGLLGLSM